MKITTPKEMKDDLAQLVETAVNQFEEQIKIARKGFNYYHLVIIGELSEDICKKITELYINAGWKACCRTSSDIGEQAGLTSLILERL